jgi:PadR family transcriptional regulator PadR
MKPPASPPGVTAGSSTGFAGPDGYTTRPGSELRNFLQCCVLLLLRERPDHGYELFERLKPFGIGDGDQGSVYRRLRSLERAGMVRSKWESSDAGPKRRTYRLTERGDALLGNCAGSLAETRRLLDYYLGRHALVVAPPGDESPQQRVTG